MKPVRIVCIGTSGYSRLLIEQVRALPDHGRLLAVSSMSPNGEYERELAAAGIRVFDKVEDMLADARMRAECIFNPTPIHLHFPMLKQCLEAGLTVWSEKPPATSVAEHREMIRLAQSANKEVGVGFNVLHTDLIHTLKKELLDGRYGPIEKIDMIAAWVRPISYFNRNDWAGRLRLGSVPIFDGTINNPFAHTLAVALFLAGDTAADMAKPDRMEVELYHANNIESEDTSSLRIILPNGTQLSSNLTLVPEKEIAPTTRIVCENATLEYSDFRSLKIDWNNGAQELRESKWDMREEMIRSLCTRYRSGKAPLCTLQTCLPFTQTVGGAFEAVPAPHPIPHTATERYDWRDRDPAFCVKGINAALTQAFEHSQLLSETGIGWSRPPRDYTFPEPVQP